MKICKSPHSAKGSADSLLMLNPCRQQAVGDTVWKFSVIRTAKIEQVGIFFRR